MKRFILVAMLAMACVAGLADTASAQRGYYRGGVSVGVGRGYYGGYRGGYYGG